MNASHLFVPLQRLLFVFCWALAGSLPAAADQGREHLVDVNVRFIDSATGHAIEPEAVSIVPAWPERTAPAIRPGPRGSVLTLPAGAHRVSLHSPRHLPLQAWINAGDDGVRNIRFLLDPANPPRETTVDYVRSLHRPDAHVVLGFIVDDETGRPISNALVRSLPGGAVARSDGRGFFQLHIPLPENADATPPARLAFQKPGYVTQQRRNLDLWPNGDWTYRVRLQPGRGVDVVDENDFRRHPVEQRAGYSFQRSMDILKREHAAASFEPASPDEPEPVLMAAGGSPAVVRVPRTIRVLLSDNATVEYVSLEFYCRRSLPHEWFSSWNNYSGGFNSLRAGAVAIRTYAIGFVNNPLAGTHDICATTSCQVYGSTTTSAADAAVNATTGYVMFRPGDSRIGFKLTEYSAENNSLGFDCGDGFTAPNSGCIEDPVCSGETRFGHGRGLCQWGSFKWATGLKVAGNGSNYPANANSGITHGFGQKTWQEIAGHYYPNLVLVQGAELIVGDEIRVTGSSVSVRQCGDGGIGSGTGCPLVTTKSVGSTGTIIDGPALITSDGAGHTWWKIQWNDGGPTIGWSPENWIERNIPVPAAPANFSATPVSTTQIEVAWQAGSGDEVGYRVEQSSGPSGPWTQIAHIAADVSSLLQTDLEVATAYYFRVRAYNFGGNSSYSAIASASTLDVPPDLAPIPDMTVIAGNPLSHTATATAQDFVNRLTDFEQFADGTSNGTVLFRQPRFSGSTSGLLDASPDSATVTGTFPANPEAGNRVLRASWSFTPGTTNPWLRLTTSGTANLPNPVIDFDRRFRFDIYTDKDLKVGLGLRETGTAPGTPIGSDGGTTGAIEFVGVPSKNGSAPNPIRTIAAGSWTAVSFDMLTTEPAQNFVGGNGVLAPGLGVLEHLAFVPAGGTGAYNVYLDNFEVFMPRVLTFSLDQAPAGMNINPSTGLITWTPSAGDGGVHPVIVRVTDNATPPQSATESFNVTVLVPPSISQQPASQSVHPGNSASFSVSATGTAPLSYQWHFEAAPVSNATNSGYSIPSVEAEHAGGYFVVVTNQAGTVTSSTAVLSLASDSSPPSVSISFPSGGARLTEGEITMTGTASDNVGVAKVEYQLNGGPLQPASGTASWSATLSLQAGSNSVMVRATDFSDNSTEITRSFTYVVFSPLTANPVGAGRIAPASRTNSPLLEIGKNYTIRARPDSGHVFTNWTDVAEVEISRDAKMVFTMQSNLVLNAHFIPSPFPPVAGTYHGLFFESSELAHHTSGHARIRVTPKGKFSGRLTVDGDTVPLSGRWELSGSVTNHTIARARQGKPPLGIDMTIDWGGSSERMFGAVRGDGWTAPLLADRATFSQANPLPMALVGSYTVVLPGSGAPEAAPPGFGHAQVTVRSNGVIRLRGLLADGARIGQSSAMSKDYLWPLHAGAYPMRDLIGGRFIRNFRGALAGWVAFTNAPLETDIKPLGGLAWIKTGWTNAHYSGGFASELSIVSSRFVAPPPGAKVIELETATMTLTDGNLLAPIIKHGTYTDKNALVVPVDGHRLRLSVNRRGLMRGRFIHPQNSAVTTRIFGIILQDQDAGFGHFLGTDQTGTAVLD